MRIFETPELIFQYCVNFDFKLYGKFQDKDVQRN